MMIAMSTPVMKSRWNMDLLGWLSLRILENLENLSKVTHTANTVQIPTQNESIWDQSMQIRALMMYQSSIQVL